MTPRQGTEVTTYARVEFPTAVGRFAVPTSLVDARYIDLLVNLLEESVESKLKPAPFRQRVLHIFPLIAERDTAEIQIAEELYEKLQELDKQGINGIWARIIKNAFAPLFQGRFDYVAGNPPWVNWESLSSDYRQETKTLWVHHGLFPHGGMDTILGKGKKDISMLMTYVAMENYLKNRGRLGFIITQSVFKTAGAGQGFRRFLLGSGTPVAVIAVDDMADLKPFEGASNRTAIVILERGRATKYPVSYSHWYKPGGGSVISEEVTLEDVVSEKIATYRLFEATPVNEDDPTSPKTYAYLKRFEAELCSRSGYRRYFSEDDAFYSMFNVSSYTFAPYKVVWREQAADLTVAVTEPLEADIIIPDHKLMMVNFQDKDKAYYLCAVLNSSPARFIVLSYGVAIQMDTHVLENVNIPQYDSTNSIHSQLAILSQQAHVATSAGDTAKVKEIEAEIDKLAAKLWGLTDVELQEIQKSLEELA